MLSQGPGIFPGLCDTGLNFLDWTPTSPNSGQTGSPADGGTARQGQVQTKQPSGVPTAPGSQASEGFLSLSLS